MENFQRFAPTEVLFYPIFCKKWKKFGASRHLKYVIKIFIGTGVKKQGRNWHVLVPGGGKNWNFWPKYLPLLTMPDYVFAIFSVFWFICTPLFIFFLTLDQTDSHHFQNIGALFYDYVCHQFDIIVNIFYLRLNLYVDFEH